MPAYEFQVQPHPRWKTEMVLQVLPEGKERLLDCIESALGGEEAIFRLPILPGEVGPPPKEPQMWSVYWKRREDDSRALVAHPDPREWVATLALEDAVLRAIQGAIDRSESFAIETLAQTQGVRLNSVSNFHLRVAFK